MNESSKKIANAFKVEQVPTDSVKPSPENDDIYNGVNEIVVEKQTVQKCVQDVAMRYTIPVSFAKGKSSLP